MFKIRYAYCNFTNHFFICILLFRLIALITFTYIKQWFIYISFIIGRSDHYSEYIYNAATKLTQLYMTVDMEVGCKKNKHLHDHFISTKVHILAYKTSLTPPHFIEKPVPNQEEFSSRVYMWFICLSLFLLYFDEIVLTVWCFFHVILYKQNTDVTTLCLCFTRRPIFKCKSCWNRITFPLGWSHRYTNPSFISNVYFQNYI